MKRKMSAAGRFYPSSKEKLEELLKIFFEDCPKENIKNIKGILAPHAGYVYSGSAAAKAYSFLKSRDFSCAVILATGHTKHIKSAALPKSDIFETPFGELQVDLSLKKKLLSSDYFYEDESAHLEEHSIETQLPFLQFIAKREFKILPICMNTQDLEAIKIIGGEISEVLKDENNIIVVSSDLSHYPPAEIAELSDQALIESYKLAIAGAGTDYFYLSAGILSEKFRENDTAACGFSPMAAACEALSKAGFKGFDKIYYCHSGKVSQDYSSVVGYCAGVFAEREDNCFLNLKQSEKKYLLKFVRSVLEKKLLGKSDFILKSNYNFYVPSAVFVTLHKKGFLRGCIGCLSPHSCLIDALQEYALAAAFSDNRFAPLTKSELREIDIEVSILSPMKEVSSHEEIKPGDGVYIKSGNFSGTYLPQVWDHFNNKEDFLNSLCQEKAGLPKNYWKEKSARLFTYRADIFGEKDFKD
ncbi:MAG: AmmeMemoRadiSam system protein B [Elusimicrobia bacterium]|nr:AmmeMemoRadiSam system protein B [Elusimicrobiota bacterium]